MSEKTAENGAPWVRDHTIYPRNGPTTAELEQVRGVIHERLRANGHDAAIYSPPIVAGGQGHTAQDATNGAVIVWVLGLAFIIGCVIVAVAR
jgi:hypothetical protein